MPDTPNTSDTSQIQGLPAGATLKPIQSAAPTGEIQGLPPGATLKPIQSEPVMGNPAFDLTTPRDAGGVGPAGVGLGAVKGVVKTAAGVGELVNKIPVVGPAITPSEPHLAAAEKWAEPQGFAEDLGNMLESGLEFAGGEEVLNAVTRVAKLEQLARSSTTVANALNKYPKLMKAVANIGKQTTVGAAQGAVKGAAEGDALKGAEGGATGAAIGSTVAEAGGAIAKPIANKMGIATSAEEDIMRAAKPGKRNDRFLADWDIAKERYAKEMDANGKYEDLNDAAERMRDQRQDLWKNEFTPKVQKHANEEMFPPKPNAAVQQFQAANPGSNVTVTPQSLSATGQVSAATNNPVSDAIRARITPAMQKASPKNAKAIETFAKRFDGPMKVGEAEDLAEHLNAELMDAGYWKKSAQERAAADKANPTLSARSAAVEAIRNHLADRLENLGETDIKELKRTYGAMRNVENEVRGQVNVASRQNPISLKQIIAIASGHPVGIAATLADKIYNEPAAILNRAVGKNIPDGPVASAAKDLVSGAATVTKKAIPAAGAGVSRMVFIGGDGKKYLGDPAKWDQIQQADPAAKQVSQ